MYWKVGHIGKHPNVHQSYKGNNKPGRFLSSKTINAFKIQDRVAAPFWLLRKLGTFATSSVPENGIKTKQDAKICYHLKAMRFKHFLDVDIAVRQFKLSFLCRCT